MKTYKDLSGLFEGCEIEKEISKYTCRQCVFRYKHEYGKMFYCSKRRQKSTAYGDLKIKVGDPACILFEHIKNRKK